MHTNCSVTISQIIPGTIVYPESLTGFINQTTDLIVNNRIKTVRRMSYGFRDDEYFFLKLIDMSRYRSA